MDQESCCPKPLQIRKTSGQTHGGHSTGKGFANTSDLRILPPNTSSLGQPSIDPDNLFSRVPYEPTSINEFNISNFRDISDKLINTTSKISTERFTPSSKKSRRIPDSSSGIMGNFVLIEPKDRQSKTTSLDRGEVSFTAPYDSRGHMQARNPYEFGLPLPFETDTGRSHSNSFKNQNGIPYRPSHVKNSHSEDNSTYNSPRISDYAFTTSKPIGHAIYRSESSPNLLPLSVFSRGDKKSSTEPSQHIRHHHYGHFIRDGPQRVVQQVHRDYDSTERSYSPFHRNLQDTLQSSHPHSPSRAQYEDSSVSSCNPHRSLTRSPTKTLDSVSEKDEEESISFQYDSNPPTKRSRSPMKKMFGDHGWLGQSPDEKPEQSSRSRKKSSAARNDNSAPNHQKKTTMMGKLMNKLEEFAEKAELNPTRSSRSERDKHPKLSMLSVLLGPPEQAKIYMEIELMLVHTANCFLMTQFSQGRIAVDSIKKIVDMWKSKGRPIVIEFMYDQATQRELVAANQHNFRFHGGRVGDEIRINSMLYNWKQVANLMAIRTFCTADTILLKLLFDIEQILELLGAGEPMMLRLQQLRASANEMMRMARQAREVNATTQAIPRGREMIWDINSSTGSGSQGESVVDPYGGLKLVPDTYK